MREKKIFSKYSDRALQNDDPNVEIDLDREFPFKNKRKEVFNLGNLYRNVKICKNCFIVYSLTSKYFDQRLKGDLKHKDWRTGSATTTNRTKITSAAPIESDQILATSKQTVTMDTIESQLTVG